MTDFAALGLSAPLLRALEEQNFTTPTAIQTATIPALLKGRDVTGVAQTGGGKTAAFVLPMLERLAAMEGKPKPGMPRALILAPTRELALQITNAIQDMARFTQVKCCAIYGGAPYRTQIHILRRGVDILVATPGRLMDHMKQGNVWLDETVYFVLDEADRMLDMGFVDDVRMIAGKLQADHQSVMFSATLSPAIKDLTSVLLKDPEHIAITPQATVADNLTHKVLFTGRETKTDLLLHMLEEKAVYKALIFTRTRRDTDELCDILCARGLKADAIHGDKQQRQRQRIIQSFRDDKIAFLVATDVAARGIDVQDVTHVFNTDVPVDPESYIHRIGRTARGGQSGTAYTFCSRGEVGLLRAIERLIKQTIEVDHDNPFPQAMGKRREFVRPEQRGGKRPGNSSDKRFEKRGDARFEKRDDKRGGFKAEGAKRFEDGGKHRPWDAEGSQKRGGFKSEGGKRFEDNGKPKRFEDGAKPRKWDAEGGEKRGGFKSEGGKRFEDGGKPKRFEDGAKPRKWDAEGGEKRGGFKSEGGKRFEDGGKPKRFEDGAKPRKWDAEGGEKRGGFKSEGEKRTEAPRGKKPFDGAKKSFEGGKAGKGGFAPKKTGPAKGKQTGGGAKPLFKKRAA